MQLTPKSRNQYEVVILVLTCIALFMEDVEILLLTETFKNTMEHGRFLRVLLSENQTPLFVSLFLCLCVCFIIANAIDDFFFFRT